MSGSQPPAATPPTTGQDGPSARERWFVAIVAALGGIVSLAWLFWRLVPKGEDAAGWSTLAKLAVAVLLALAITAMLRFALAPLGRSKSALSTSLAPTQADPDAAVRRWITPIVFGVGSGAIIILALGIVIAFAVLAAEPGNNNVLNNKIDTLLNGIFGAVLPIFATWVGTVIAFYFTSANFQQAAKIAREATTAAVPQSSVLDRMIPYDKVAKIERPRAEAREVHMDDVVKLFSPPVTRVIVFDHATRQPIFIIRQKRVPADWLQNPAAHTIDEYLKQTVEGRPNAEDAAQFEFIVQTANLDEARTKMTSANCVDLFVTASGQKTQPVLGWLTDDLVK
jgi:hypothetical protein